MSVVCRVLRTVSSSRGRLFFSSASTTSPTEPQTAKGEEESFFDMDKFVDSIGMDVRSKNQGLSFARMLRESKLMQLGDIDGRVVTGKIVHRMQDDLYIDFGLKFNAVCKAPAVNGDAYRVGSSVLLKLHDVELSERFLGSKKDLTLLEADATLIRLLRSGARKDQPKKNDQEAPAPPTAAAKPEQTGTLSS